MERFNDFKDSVTFPEKIEKQFAWFGYKNGEAKQFNSESEAKAFSVFTEEVCINQNEIDAYSKALARANEKVEDLWLSALRYEFNWLSEKHFDLCYSKAYDRGHSAGMDEVANCMCGIAYFAQEIIDAIDK